MKLLEQQRRANEALEQQKRLEIESLYGKYVNNTNNNAREKKLSEISKAKKLSNELE